MADEVQETTDQVEETTEAQATEETTPESEMDTLRAELDKWKSMSRKNEQTAKANAQAAKELEEIKKSQLTDQEKLIEQTKEETATAIRKEFAGKLVDAEFKGQLQGRTLKGDAILSFNKDEFITDTGDIDTEAIQQWVEANSNQSDVPVPDLGQGARGTNPSKSQIRSRDELSNMTPAEILAARTDGRLDYLMGKQ